MDNELKYEHDIKLSKDGLIFSDNSRAVIVPTSSFGILRKDLYENIGKERVKGFLIRYGSDLGRKDGKVILKRYNDEPIESIIKIGPIYHQRRGDVIPTVTHIEVENHGHKVSTYLEGIWEKSYEAVEHIEHFGIDDEPVCYTLVGYASGFLTEICNQTVLFKEVKCVGKGDEVCSFVARTVDYWTEDMSDELKYYKEEPIVKELELTYEKLLEERNHLQHVSTIYNKLTEQFLKEKDLQTIMKIVFDLMNTPIIVENAELAPIASGGISSEQLEIKNHVFKDYVQSKESMRKNFHQTKIISLEDHKRMVTPIHLKGKTIGYCSFIYEELEVEQSKFLQMIIERISSICALYLLNKKTESEAEERMKGRFLEQILNEEYTKEDIVRRSSFIGFNLFQPYYMVVIQFKLLNIDYMEELTFLEKAMNRTSAYFQSRGKNILMGQQGNNLVLLFVESELKVHGIRETCCMYLEYLNEIYPTISVRAGISLQSNEIERASNGYQEALTALRMTTATNEIMEFQSLGVLGPLINSNNKKEIERIAMYKLTPLCNDIHDDKSLELIKTLYIYLLNGGNLEQTASDLALSLSGLRYRIRKIEKLLEEDVRDPKTSYQLLLSIQALISTGTLDLDSDR